MENFSLLGLILNIFLSSFSAGFSISGSFSIGEAGYGGTCGFVGDNEDAVCSKHSGNPCECYKAGCEYSLHRESCVPLITCQQRMSKCPGTQFEDKCLRAGSFYSHGGVICKNEVNSGNCGGVGTVVSVMTELKDKPVSDTRGVVYLPNRKFEDPNNSRKAYTAENTLNWCKAYTPRWTAEQAKDSELYAGLVGGTANGCLSYKIPEIEGAGSYEMSLKLMETAVSDTKHKRIFIVKIGELTVLNQINIFRYVGFCMPMEIIIPFEISLNNEITMQGLPPIPNDEENFGKFSLCFGDCADGPDVYLNYEFSSFYIARLNQDM